jgi:uncharacterized protein
MKKSKPDLEGAKQYALGRLQAELPRDLYYHGLHHTRDDVYPAVCRLAVLAGLHGEPFMLLETAALYHDMGYLERYARNEEIGAAITRDILPQFGYSSEQIATITGIIMATQLPQSPQNFLAEILCDADLDSLGRKDFFVSSQSLRLELIAYGASYNLRQWYELQQQFLSQHTYFTATARALRNTGKQRNLTEIEALLKSVNGHR